MKTSSDGRIFQIGGCRFSISHDPEMFHFNPDLLRFMADDQAQSHGKIDFTIFSDPYGVKGFYFGPDEDRRAYLQRNRQKIGLSEHFVDNCGFNKSSAFWHDIDNEATQVVVPENNLQKVRLNAVIINHLNNLLPCRSGLFLHGAAGIIAGRAYTIVGIPGSGKSTAIEMINNDFLLSDDMTVVNFSGNETDIYSTPLGPNTDGPGSAPLGAVFFPVKSDHFELRPVKKLEAIKQYFYAQVGFWEQVLKPYRKEHFESVCRLFSRVRAYEMHFRKDSIDNLAISQALHI